MSVVSKCPLCNLNNEHRFYEDSEVIIVRTKNLKGHDERVMIVSKRHNEVITPMFESLALNRMEEVGKTIFTYTPKFVIMDMTFATVKDHWHRVCTDLDPKSEDFEQILETRWLRVVETR